MSTHRIRTLVEGNAGLRWALCAQSFFGSRHTSVSRYTERVQEARHYIAQARAAGWRGSIRQALGLTLICLALSLVPAGRAGSPTPQSPIAVTEQPTLSIRVDARTGDVWLTVVSTKPWRLEWSGDLETWVELRRGTPDPGAWDVFQGVDRGWAKVAQRGFYRLLTEVATPLPPVAAGRVEARP